MRVWVALANFSIDHVFEYIYGLREFVSEVAVDRICKINHGWVSLIEFDVRFISKDVQPIKVVEETGRNVAYSGWMRNIRTGEAASSFLNDVPFLPNLDDDAIVGEFSCIEVNGDCAKIVSDHYAIHPSYYWRGGGGKWIASNDLRLLFLARDVPLDVARDSCIDAIDKTFLIGENELPEGRTFFGGILKLKPSRTLILERNGAVRCIGPARRGKLKSGLAARSLDDYVEEFRETLNQCVLDRIEAGAGGLMLSGGVDSNSVLGASLLCSRHSPLFCVNVSFKDRDLSMSQDDKLVGMLVHECNVPSEIIYADDFLRLLKSDDPIAYLDGPEMVANPLAKEACASVFQDNGVSMVMTGEGGDAVLGESMHYWILDSIRAHDGLKAAHRYVCGNLMVRSGSYAYFSKIIESILPGYGIRNLRRRELRGEPMELPGFIVGGVRKKLECAQMESRSSGDSARQRYIAHEYVKSMLWPRASYFDAINTYCVHSHPYLDPRMMDFALSCPPHLHHDYERVRLSNPYATSKRLARKAYCNVLPDYATNKKIKTSYALMARRMFQNSREQILDLARRPMVTHEWGLIDQKIFRRYLTAYIIATEDPNAQLGPLYHYIRGVIDLENWLARLSGTRAEVIERIKFRPLRRLGEWK